MKKYAAAVIGAGYGDEGKGLMTDRLASERSDVTVVRSNGGAQAGHTVTTPDGRRHVFSHFSSGSFVGATTHLSEFFVSNPMFFLSERKALADSACEVTVTADPAGPVTTPYDIMINQAVEERRGGARHGSCGMGFGETLERTLVDEFTLNVADLRRGGTAILSKLERIRRQWVPFRLSKLGFDGVPPDMYRLLSDYGIVDRYLQDCEAFSDTVDLKDDASLSGAVIFEAAQGLLLDQDYGVFPYVTRSNTGLRNMVRIAEKAGIDRIETVYMTRAYTTRHGAGPMAHEGEDMSFADIQDPTNRPNNWQGSLRAAPLDLAVLTDAIKHDMVSVQGAVDIAASIGISCMDQVSRPTVHTRSGSVSLDAASLPGLVETETGFGVSYTSFGPSRADVSPNR